ncbi:phasin family protein [Ovoidimarina sediminis]|uniref:phasin family protein n=1 Tax=Ovoidimarina sediminis TaxID=3079856 RepID=UPI00290AE2FC|nr:phasin family protein [Rhodophyticola sp. MJ-SS7]MDU8943579.1 phasin family protein [Rhodophyticola sp. MJ-SS7]
MTGKSPSPTKANGAAAAPGLAMPAIPPAVTAQWLEVMTASGRFIAQRLEEDLKTQQAFLGCRTPADVMQVQSGYYKTAVEQYTAQAGRIFELMSGAISGPLASSRSMFARGYDDVPL